MKKLVAMAMAVLAAAAFADAPTSSLSTLQRILLTLKRT